MALPALPSLLCLLSDDPSNPCGGLGERFKHLLPRLAPYFDVRVVCLGPAMANTHLEAIPIHAFHKSLSSAHGAALPVYWAAYAAEIARRFGHPDIVLSADHMAAWPGVILSRLTGAQFVMEFDLALYAYEKLYKDTSPIAHAAYAEHAGLIHEAERVGAEEADVVLTCSEAYAKELPYETKQKPVAVPNGIDAEVWTAARPRYAFAGNHARNLVFIGRLNAQKGLNALLDAPLPPNTGLHVVGGPRGGELYHRVKAFCARSPTHHHVEWIAGEEKIALLQSADAIVFPSLHEPFGIVGLEAMAAGTLLVTTRANGITDYADDTNSILCGTTSESIGAALVRAVSLLPAERSAMIEAGRATAGRFSWDAAAATMVSALRGCTSA